MECFSNTSICAIVDTLHDTFVISDSQRLTVAKEDDTLCVEHKEARWLEFFGVRRNICINIQP